MRAGLKEAFPEPDSTVGLSFVEAKRRLDIVGPNEISSSGLRSRFAELGGLFLDPMGLMLLGLAGLYAILGDSTDAVILLIAWVPVTAVDVVLELRASGALKALRAQLSPIAKVLRESGLHDVEIREIVPGDLVVFEEGQAFPADGRILEADHLTVNESALTGESVPVEKSKIHKFFSGTQVLTGRGLGLVERTAGETRFGKIAGMLEGVEASPSPLKKQVDILVRRVLIGAAALAAGLFGLEIARTGSFVPSLIVALTFGMAAVPEEFPLVFTLYLSLGAWRLSKRRILVKSLPSVEALGSADILCTDKTGTLTEGRFQLEEVRGLAGTADRSVWESALMACELLPVDSMEVAIHEKGRDYVDALKVWSLVWDYPFEKQGKHMTHVWRRSDSSLFRTVMKGAVEGVLEHCEVSQDERLKIESLVKQYAAQGKRLLGLAMREGSGTGDRKTDEQGLKFLGVLVFSDPIRLSVAKAIAECQAAGIEVKMLTGDHPFTAHYVADQAGIKHSHDCLYTGDELSKMDDSHRREAYLKGAIFSRVLPEQKYEMVKVLRAEGRIVAMTGDGINDAPALKLADIGISMGHNATDVARSAAQIVLLDSDFSGIVAAMLEGRRILSNLKKSFSYLISFHIPVILLALVPPLLGWSALLLPVHIIILELVVHPVSAFAFENLSVVQNSRPNSEKSGTLIGRNGFVKAALPGLLVSLGALFCYRYISQVVSVDVARSCAFSAVLLGNVAFVASNIWPQFNIRFTITALALTSFVALIAFFPLIQLHLLPMGLRETAMAFGGGALGVLPDLFDHRKVKSKVSLDELQELD
jgi:Ca2+-transporting ATPase